MRGDCRSNDAVHLLTGKFFTDRLFKIFKICAGADPANRKSGDNNPWRQIRPGPYRRPYVLTNLLFV